MKLSREEIMFIREQALKRMVAGTEEAPRRPSRKYRIAMAGSKKPFNFEKSRRRRKMAKESRRRNRR